MAYYETFRSTQMSDRQARTSDSFKMREKFKSSRRDATEERDGSVVSAEATMAAETATLRPMDIDYDRCAGPSDDADDPA